MLQLKPRMEFFDVKTKFVFLNITYPFILFKLSKKLSALFNCSSRIRIFFQFRIPDPQHCFVSLLKKNVQNNSSTKHVTLRTRIFLTYVGMIFGVFALRSLSYRWPVARQNMLSPSSFSSPPSPPADENVDLMDDHRPESSSPDNQSSFSKTNFALQKEWLFRRRSHASKGGILACRILKNTWI